MLEMVELAIEGMNERGKIEGEGVVLRGEERCW